jgi:hypothetical protein
LENYGLGTGTHNEFSKIPGELPAISKSLLSPQKEIVFPARRSLITDIRAGALNSPFIFVSVYLCLWLYVSVLCLWSTVHVSCLYTVCPSLWLFVSIPCLWSTVQCTCQRSILPLLLGSQALWTISVFSFILSVSGLYISGSVK